MIPLQNSIRQSGIKAVGDIPWGSHFCQFYQDESDLTDTLVPYFEAGLSAGESCLWVTGKKLEAEKAEDLMTAAVPEFKRFVSSGQMEFVSISDWYSLGDTFDIDSVLQGWIDKEKASKARGFTGLRLTGDTSWIDRVGWTGFMDYERKVNSSFRRYNIIALCTYCLDNCNASDVLDVCCEHQFALARRSGNWELLESSSLKVAKGELLRANSELEARVDARTSELTASVAARDEFLAMLGHELRNPLAPIRNAAEVIQTFAPIDSPIANSFNILCRQLDHLTKLVDELLDVARVTQGTINFDLKPTSLRDIIAHAVEQTRSFIDVRNQSLTIGLPSISIHVNADITRLTQVFSNLLHNAAKFTPNGGAIGIKTIIEKNEIVVTVTDNGSGIPEEMLTSIFGIFTQLPRSLARSEGGLGIGLTVVKRIIDMHQGSIEAISQGINKGAEFVVRLPIDDAMEFDTVLAVDEAARPSQFSKKLAKILVVDDNKDARDALGTLLESHGYEVALAKDGNSAIQESYVFNPDVVILDIGLPDISGYEVARHLRERLGSTKPKLIALTGYGQSHDIQRATAAGFDAHILKPAQITSLLSKITSLSS